MGLSVKKKSVSRWDGDIYVGWVPWSQARWWSANRFRLSLWFVVTLLLSSIWAGAWGIILGFFGFLVGVGVHVRRNRLRGIGLATPEFEGEGAGRKKFVVVFYPGGKLAIPVSSLMSVGVLRRNKISGVSMRPAKGSVLRNSWVGKFWGAAGNIDSRDEFKEMFLAPVTPETRMDSGRGKIVCIRDLEGNFWPVSVASGFEVATLRDLAIAAKVPFFTEDDPFNVSIRATTEGALDQQMLTKKQRKRVNKAEKSSWLRKDSFVSMGGRKVGSWFRRRSFVDANSYDGELPHEVRIEESGFVGVDRSTKLFSLKKMRSKIFVGVAALAIFGVLLPGVVIYSLRDYSSGIMGALVPDNPLRSWVIPDGWALNDDSVRRVTAPVRSGGVADYDIAIIDQVDGKGSVNVFFFDRFSDRVTCEEEIFGVPGDRGIGLTRSDLGRDGDYVYLDLGDLQVWCYNNMAEDQMERQMIFFEMFDVEDPVRFIDNFESAPR